MRNLIPFTFCALLALSYFGYPGTTDLAWYFALGAIVTNLIALGFLMRYGFDICLVDPWYSRVNISTNVFNVLWLCSIQYAEYVGTHYVFALVIPFWIAATFLPRLQKFIMYLTGK